MEKQNYPKSHSLKMGKPIALLLLTILYSPSFLQAQREIDSSKHVAQFEELDFEGSKYNTWYPKGFDIQIAAGAYFGNKYNAAYYNGSPQNENNIYYLLDNKYWYDDIHHLIVNTYPYVSISDSIFLDALPQDMRYSVGMSIAFGFRYKFNRNWGINLNYTFARLKATDVFTMDYPGPWTNQQVGRPFQEYLIGIEQRSIFDLSVSYLFHPHHILKPFVELGVQFNFLDITKFFALFENQLELNMLDYYNGVDYVPGVQIQQYDVQFGGPGYGVSLVAGLKIVFNKFVSIDPIFYLSASSFNHNGYKNLALNYGAYLRIVMSDLVFSSYVK